MLKIFNLIKFILFVQYQSLKHYGRKTSIKWFSSDLHFNHTNVINYCNRPFFSTKQMDYWISRYWNSIVKPQDIVYILGDFSINPKNHPKYLTKLCGYKILIVGNHCHGLQFGKGSPGKRDKINVLLKAYWHEVHPELIETLSNGVVVKLHHMPYRNEFTKEIDDRYWHKRPEDEGHFLLCGHQHARYVKSKNMIDVGFDGSLSFYSESDIIALMNDPRDYIPSRITEYYKNRKDDRKVDY